MKEVKNIIKNTFSIVSALTIIFFVIVFIWFGCSGIEGQLKETFTLTIGFFTGLATLGAAYVAANLFNDWRVIHNNTSLKELAVETYKTYSTLQVKLISINDSFVKSLKANKVNNFYDIQKIADDVELEIKEIGDLLALLIHQISFLDDLAKHKDIDHVVDKMHSVIMDYITIMDISKYRQLNNHTIFANREMFVKIRFDELREPFTHYLRSFILIDM